MLDHLSQGRLELGVGRGVVPFELAHYDVTPEISGDMFNEALDILVAGFTQDVLSYEGKYFSYKDVGLWIHPLQQPYPPLWYATNNPESIPWVARHGINTAHIFHPISGTKPHFDLYKRVWGEHQYDPGRLNSHVGAPKIGIVRHVYVAATDRQAEEECKGAFAAWFHNLNYLFARAGSNRLENMSDFDSVKEREMVLAGSPETVRAQVKKTVDDTRCNYFCCIFAFGDLSPEQTMRSMRLFVEEIMPSF